jgi:ferrochelatase
MLGKEGFAVKAVYTHVAPYIEQAAPDAIILPLYPHYSSSLAGGMKKRAPGRCIIEHWYEKEKFIKMTAANINKSVAGLEPEKTAIMFVAHSLPESFVINGDQYIGQTNETFRALEKFFPGYKASLSYIGKAGPQKWVGPAAQDVIGGMKYIDNIIAAYISFPLDNIEVLYDMDIKLREKAVETGIKNFTRAPLLNDSDEFAGFLADIIRGNK